MTWSPNNHEAEQSVIGAMLKDGGNDNVLNMLTHSDFYNKQHGIFFKAISDMFNNNEEIDFMLVCDKVGDEHLADLGTMVQLTPSTANIIGYAKIVANKSAERKALAEAQKAIEIIQGDGSTEDKLNQVVTNMSSLDFSMAEEYKPTHVKELCEEWLDIYDERINNPELAGTSTGIKGLDDILGHRLIGDTDLTVIGAASKSGKTQLAISIASNIARANKKTVLIFSLEMPKEQIFERLLTNESKVASSNFYQAMDEMDFSKIGNALSILTEQDIFVDDRPGLSLAQIKAATKKHIDEHGKCVVFVDYLTLISGTSSCSTCRTARSTSSTSCGRASGSGPASASART